MTLPADIIATMGRQIDTRRLDNGLSAFGMTIGAKFTALRQGRNEFPGSDFVLFGYLMAIGT